MRFDWIEFFQFQNMIVPLWETIYMVGIATLISLIIGFPIGILLVTSEEKGIKPNKSLHKILDVILVNITRSIPFIILMVLLLPLMRFIVGTSIGSVPFIIPLAFDNYHAYWVFRTCWNYWRWRIRKFGCNGWLSKSKLCNYMASYNSYYCFSSNYTIYWRYNCK